MLPVIPATKVRLLLLMPARRIINIQSCIPLMFTDAGDVDVVATDAGDQRITKLDCPGVVCQCRWRR